MAGAKKDPELIKQLAAAAKSGRPVEAVFMLHDAADPERVEKIVADVVARVAGRLGYAVEDSNVFRNLGSFVVSARPEFLRELMRQPEIASAIANRKRMLK